MSLCASLSRRSFSACLAKEGQQRDTATRGRTHSSSALLCTHSRAYTHNTTHTHAHPTNTHTHTPIESCAQRYPSSLLKTGRLAVSDLRVRIQGEMLSLSRHKQLHRTAAELTDHPSEKDVHTHTHLLVATVKAIVCVCVAARARV